MSPVFTPAWPPPGRPASPPTSAREACRPCCAGCNSLPGLLRMAHQYYDQCCIGCTSRSRVVASAATIPPGCCARCTTCRRSNPEIGRSNPPIRRSNPAIRQRNPTFGKRTRRHAIPCPETDKCPRPRPRRRTSEPGPRNCRTNPGRPCFRGRSVIGILSKGVPGPQPGLTRATRPWRMAFEELQRCRVEGRSSRDAAAGPPADAGPPSAAAAPVEPWLGGRLDSLTAGDP